MVLIGLTGTHGAGKGTVAKYLVREHNFIYIGVSEFLASEAERRGIKSNRMARHNIANEYRERGPTALLEAAYSVVDSNIERLILEPEYTQQEVQFIQSKEGVVISVDASLETRFERISKRESTKDNVSFEIFKKEQEMEMSSKNSDQQNLFIAMNTADIHMQNNRTVEEFEQAISEVLDKQNIL